jgi:amino acid permease
MIITTAIVLLTVFVACAIGYLGYLAFGDKTKSVILFNLPNDDPASIIAKIFYILTVMGSFVLVANPVFRVIETSNWYRYIAGLTEEETPEPTKSEKETPDAKN